MLSLNSRLLLGASLVLVCFLGLTGLALDRAFRDSAEGALRDRLQGYIYALLAAADLQPDGLLHWPQELPEPRFSQAGSGLYAQIISNDGGQYWQSPSMLGIVLPLPSKLSQGERVFSQVTDAEGVPFYRLSFGVTYVGPQNREQHYTFSATESLDSLHAQVRQFRRSLWVWLGGAALVLLAVQGSILRWSLAPLRRAEQDLIAIERGESTELTGHYPRELQGLTENLNALLRNDRGRVERYRQTLGELAHSLKTPLAVLWGTLDGKTSCEQLPGILQREVSRMTQIVDYQLQRAAASGRSALAAPIAVGEAARRIVESLNKVYADKGVRCELRVPPAARFYGPEGDLLEILGNLLDNAYKWCRQRVRVGAAPLALPAADRQHAGVSIWVEDDGPGIPSKDIQELIARRSRAADAVPGHGIGLRVVHDITALYDGSLHLGTSELGGARVEVSLSGA